jgi:hypothetical protein
LKKALIPILAILIAAGAYLAYTQWFAEGDADPWDFIPSKAAIVWESDHGLATYDSAQQKGIWSAIGELSAFTTLTDRLAKLDAIHSDVSLRVAFDKTYTLIGVFPTSATEMDALLVIKLTTTANTYLKKSLSQFKKEGFKTKSRVYNEITIQEIYDKDNGTSFSYFIKGNVLVGSYTPFLTEDAVRTYNDTDQLSFKSAFSDLGSVNPLKNDLGNLFVNTSELSRLFSLFSTTDFTLPGGSSFLDMDVKQNSLKLSGFTFPQENILSTFSSGPVSFDLLEVVPNNTAFLKHYSFESAADWRSKLVEKDENIRAGTAQIKSQYDVDMDFLFTQIRNEFAIAELEVLGQVKPDRLIFFDVNDADETRSFMRQVASRMTRDSVFTDPVGEYEISRINDATFASALLGEQSELVGECYYLMYRNYIVLSNSLAQLKRLLQSIETDNTWRKSLRVNNMLDLANKEANFSVLINVPRVWNLVMNNIKEEWKPFFQSNEAGFKSLEYIGIQYSKVDTKFYTSITAYQPETPRRPSKVDFGERASLPAKIITKPFVIRSHVNQSLEVMVQDSLLQLYHLSSDFQILWTQRLKDVIVESIRPVDYYNNGKIQYAFATKSQLHIIDRTGTYIEGFPVSFSSKNPMRYFSVVDYDGSKNYRFMCTDAEGNIYLYDKQGKVLNGWAPKVGGRSIIAPPAHIRVAGKDAFVILRKRGIDLVTRMGVSYPGFPKELEINLAGSYFTEATGSLETSKLTTISEGGEIIRFNFSGKIEFREQLVKPTTNATFELLPDVLDNTYVILRSSEQSWEVLDASGAKLFEKAYFNSADKGAQFYRFGGDKTLLLMADSEEGFLTVYDLNGNTLSQKPLKTNHPASVIYFENQGVYQFYLSSGKNVEKVRLN